MPRVRRYDKRRGAPRHPRDLGLPCYDAESLVKTFGSLEAAQDRWEEVVERGDVPGKPWDCEAWWALNAPPELHVRPDRDPRHDPETFAAQEHALEDFEARRAEWLEWNGYS